MHDSNQRWRRAGRTLLQVGRVLAGRQLAGRNLTVYPDDVLLVSYPRSGNTWARFLLGNLINHDDPVTFANIESRIPEIYFNSDRVMRSLPSPRLLKSHECFQPHYRRIIYIVRDPRDVAISFYHHNVKAGNIPDGYPMQDFIPRFINAEFDAKWGSWSDHVRSWLLLRQGQPDFILLRYEDMKREPARELERVATFLQRLSFAVKAGPEELQRAIELSSPERMRALEQQQAGKWAVTKNTRPDKPFIRSATAGGWKSQLPEESIASLELAWGNLMRSLGYDLHTSVIPLDVKLPTFFPAASP
ncbi:MAG TPA: sulfotransferase domain-containing protein [Candidatus Sulfotelmatobacter sp.]|jgi:anaerobic selenocysteine-containing dehydrogenase